MTPDDIDLVLSAIQFEHHPTLSVRWGVDGGNMTELSYWLQLRDSALPKEFNSGRKWRLSQFMCASEIVGTAFAAYKAWLEHEMMESFTYKGVQVFSPHLDIEARVRLASDPSNYEYRS